MRETELTGLFCWGHEGQEHWEKHRQWRPSSWGLKKNKNLSGTGIWFIHVELHNGSDFFPLVAWEFEWRWPKDKLSDWAEERLLPSEYFIKQAKKLRHKECKDHLCSTRLHAVITFKELHLSSVLYNLKEQNPQWLETVIKTHLIHLNLYLCKFLHNSANSTYCKRLNAGQ